MHIPNSAHKSFPQWENTSLNGIYSINGKIRAEDLLFQKLKS